MEEHNIPEATITDDGQTEISSKRSDGLQAAVKGTGIDSRDWWLECRCYDCKFGSLLNTVGTQGGIRRDIGRGGNDSGGGSSLMVRTPVRAELYDLC